MVTKAQPADSYDLSRSLGFLVHDVARLMRRAFDRRVKHLELTRSQWFALAHLYRTDGQTQRDLADELDMQRAPLSKLLDRLEVGGWIERRADPVDRRVNRVFKTNKIDPLMGNLLALGQSLTEDIFVGISDREREQFLKILARAKSNLIDLECKESSSLSGARFV